MSKINITKLIHCKVMVLYGNMNTKNNYYTGKNDRDIIVKKSLFVAFLTRYIILVQH